MIEVYEVMILRGLLTFIISFLVIAVILRGLLKFIISLLVIALIAGAGAIAAYWYINDTFHKKASRQDDAKIEIARGSGLINIAEQLQNNRLISNRLIFRAGVMLNGDSKKLKAGYYLIPKDASMSDIMMIITKGKEHLLKITFAEGLTSQQIVNLINDNDSFNGKKISQIPPEGSLMPDTYSYRAHEQRHNILNKMLDARVEFINSLNVELNEDYPLKNMNEVIILASIVEKETGIASERDRVAAVFINRLNKGMRLQSDPTIIYGLVGGKGKLGHPLRRSEMKKKTQYNTYQIDGLPPTAICNPGRASIEAVLFPANTNDIFFVADGTGGHSFAETLIEHNKNVKKWRKIEKERAQAIKKKQQNLEVENK